MTYCYIIFGWSSAKIACKKEQHAGKERKKEKGKPLFLDVGGNIFLIKDHKIGHGKGFALNFCCDSLEAIADSYFGENARSFRAVMAMLISGWWKIISLPHLLPITPLYQSPIAFHHSPPIANQIKRNSVLVKKPCFHQSLRST